MIEQLSREDQQMFIHRYLKNDLFCHWSPLLIQMKIERNELDVPTLWYQADMVLDKLRIEEKDRRSVLIPFIYLELLEDFKIIRLDNGTTINRSDILAEQSAVTVMCIVLTELMNAVLPGHEGEEFDNSPICVAIANIIRNHPHTKFLMDRFFKKGKDDSGKDIVITPYDPMKNDDVTRHKSDKVAEEIEAMEQRIIQLTSGLKVYFAKYWGDWNDFCHKVCLDAELLYQLYKVEPSGNEWGINQKMVCNMVGLFNREKDLKQSIRKLNSALSEKQLRSYINNYTDYKGSDSALTRIQHYTLKRLLRKKG